MTKEEKVNEILDLVDLYEEYNYQAKSATSTTLVSKYLRLSAQFGSRIKAKLEEYIND